MSGAQDRPVPTPAALPAATIWLGGLVPALALCHFTAALDRSLFSLLLTPVKASLGLSDTELGLLQGTGFAVFYALAIMPAGLLADRVDRRRLVMAGLLVWSAGVLGYGFAPRFPALFAASLLVGLGQAVLLPSALSLLSEIVHPRARGRGTALLTSSALAGRTATLIGGGLLLAALTVAQGASTGPVEPWRQVIFASLLVNAAALLALLASRAPGRPRPPSDGAGKRWLAVLRWLGASQRLYLHLFAMMSATVLGTQSVAAWTPTLLHRHFGLGVAEAALLAGGITVLAGIAGHAAGGWLIDAAGRTGGRRGPFHVGAGTLALAGSCLAVFTLADSRPLALMGLAGFAASIGAAAPAGLSALQALTPAPMRGSVSGLMLAATTLCGLGLGPFLVGLASDRLAGGTADLGHAILLVVVPALLIGIAAASAGAKIAKA